MFSQYRDKAVSMQPILTLLRTGLLQALWVMLFHDVALQYPRQVLHVATLYVSVQAGLCISDSCQRRLRTLSLP